MSPHPSPTEKRHRPDPQQVITNDKITNIAHFHGWRNQINAARDDSEWRNFFSLVTWTLTNKNIPDILPPQTEAQSIVITNNFSENELREWKDGVRKGLEEGDWTDLVIHRECPKD